MNSDPEKIRALLHEVLPSSGEFCGPAKSEILSMLRRERERRCRLRAGTALLAIVAVAVGVFVWNPGTTAPTPVVSAPHPPAPSAIRRVSDEELFTLLQGAPTALMKLPDGSSRLLILE
jgi:hypothetical protein